MITINLDKAKDITKERLRQERKPLLEAQDILFMQAQESGADTTAIVVEKQRLRDITNLADSCTTTDELKALNCNNQMAYIYETNHISRDSASHQFVLSSGSPVPGGFRLSGVHGNGHLLGEQK